MTQYDNRTLDISSLQVGTGLTGRRFCELVQISPTTFAKLKNGQPVRIDIVTRILHSLSNSQYSRHIRQELDHAYRRSGLDPSAYNYETKLLYLLEELHEQLMIISTSSQSMDAPKVVQKLNDIRSLIPGCIPKLNIDRH